jgi:hypothetical protein
MDRGSEVRAHLRIIAVPRAGDQELLQHTTEAQDRIRKIRQIKYELAF